jgi:hypothetical protein
MKAIAQLLKLAGVTNTAPNPESRIKQIRSQELFEDILETAAIIRHQKTLQYGDHWMGIGQPMTPQKLCAMVHDIRRKFHRLERADTEVHLRGYSSVSRGTKDFYLETLQDMLVYCGIGIQVILGSKDADQP